MLTAMHLRLGYFMAVLIVFACTLSVRGDSASAAAGAADSASGSVFKTSLAKDCHVIENGALKPVPADAFAKTRLFVVYYTHISCGSCVPFTKKLNAWLAEGKAPAGVTLVLGYRAEADNAELKKYMVKSDIRFPAIDTKWIRARRANARVMHPFYQDADEGAPRFRFFQADGAEIDPRPHGIADIYGGKVMEQFDALLPKMLR